MPSNSPTEYLGSFVSAPKNMDQLKFQQQSAPVLGKSMNFNIPSAQPISSSQRVIVTDSEYTIPEEETTKYAGVVGLIPVKNKTIRKTNQRTQLANQPPKQIQRKGTQLWEF